MKLLKHVLKTNPQNISPLMLGWSLELKRAVSSTYPDVHAYIILDIEVSFSENVTYSAANTCSSSTDHK